MTFFSPLIYCIRIIIVVNNTNIINGQKFALMSWKGELKMASENKKIKNQQNPVEKHDMAAWANTKVRKRISNVNIPDDFQSLYAKEYVDSNQK